MERFEEYFEMADKDRDGRISGAEAVSFLRGSNLSRRVLAKIWGHVHQNHTGFLSRPEFYNALRLVTVAQSKRKLTPDVVEETLYTAASADIPPPQINVASTPMPQQNPVAASPLPHTRATAQPSPQNFGYRQTVVSTISPNQQFGTLQPNTGTSQTFMNQRFRPLGWEASTSVRSHQALHGAQPVTPAGFRPPMQQVISQPEGPMQFNQRSVGGHAIDNFHTNQLSNGGTNILDTEEQEAAETSDLAENTEKMLLDSRDKLEFYRTVMQDLVLYRSRCDKRLNEIIERARADKAEAELLEKKYQEKYNQLAEIHSKLAVEEAAFCEIQARKSDLEQAIIKMDQCGNPDGILQVRADRIQSDLEELTKAFADRCKKHSLEIKSPALIELPPGWQPGIPDVAAICDEDWDKLEDECFQDLIPSVPTALPLAERMSLCSIP